MKQTVDTLAAEQRVIEEGLRAKHNRDGTFSVRSVSRRGLRWKVRIEAVCVRGRWMLRAICECESGRARQRELIACQHGACVLRSLERRGLADWSGGIWVPAGEARRAVAC